MLTIGLIIDLNRAKSSKISISLWDRGSIKLSKIFFVEAIKNLFVSKNITIVKKLKLISISR